MGIARFGIRGLEASRVIPIAGLLDNWIVGGQIGGVLVDVGRHGVSRGWQSRLHLDGGGGGIPRVCGGDGFARVGGTSRVIF